MPLAVIGGYLVCLALLARWGRESIAHRRRINKLDFRIHVNGIRGKSTVTRIIAGLLREGGVVTVAKSTGTAAAVINREGIDEPINRKAAPTILEQIEVTKKYVFDDVRALVIECMAWSPKGNKRWQDAHPDAWDEAEGWLTDALTPDERRSQVA